MNELYPFMFKKEYYAKKRISVEAVFQKREIVRRTSASSVLLCLL